MVCLLARHCAGGGGIPQHKTYLVKKTFNMKKFIILLLFLGIFVQCANAAVTLKCSAETSSVYGGECVISGSGRLTLDKPIQADKLIVANATFNPADKILALYLTGQNHINEIIIMREGGTGNDRLPAWLELSLRSDAAAIRPRSIRIENLTKSANVRTPYYLRLPDTALSTLVNQDGVQAGQYGAYIPTRNTGTSGGGEATQEVNSLHLKTQHQSNYSNQC